MQLGMQREEPAIHEQRSLSAAQTVCETMFQQGPWHFRVTGSQAQPSVVVAVQLVGVTPVHVLGPQLAVDRKSVV